MTSTEIIIRPGKISISDTSYKVAKEGKIVTNLVNVDTGAPWAHRTAGVSDIEELSKANGDTVKFVLDDQNEIRFRLCHHDRICTK